MLPLSRAGWGLRVDNGLSGLDASISANSRRITATKRLMQLAWCALYMSLFPAPLHGR
jgi:hypothetical protein